ncbi:MAG: hypothetical protein N4A50_01995 [Vallitalea sp.]|jgi:hypothetical protein|nr:hypothetical protein [Vallitalea sp.]
MESNQIANELIEKEQLLLLYENLIDEGLHLYNIYKSIHNKLISHENRNIVQDIMKTRLYQIRELISIYNKLSGECYRSKQSNVHKKNKLKKMFAKESNYVEAINHIYANTNDIVTKVKLTKLIQDENIILFRLLYLQSLIGICWEANDK